MNQEIKEMVLNGITYVPKGAQQQAAQDLDGMPYRIIRGDRSGVFAAYVKSESEDGRKVVLVNARRLWAWYGAASLSQLAVEGVTELKKCKFPCEMPMVIITDCIENIECSEMAKQLIADVSVWKR